MTLDIPQLWRTHLSKIGKTWSIDFMIGNKSYVGRELAAPSLESFTKFVHEKVDSRVDIFL